MIKIFKDNYDKKEFYGLMGHFFAETEYKKAMPYLKNTDKLIWYVNLDENNDVIAFNNYEETSNKIEFKATYFTKNIKDLRELLEIQIKKLNNKLIETANCNPNIINLFKELGFKEYKKTTNYTFLRKEN